MIRRSSRPASRDGTARSALFGPPSKHDKAIGGHAYPRAFRGSGLPTILSRGSGVGRSALALDRSRSVIISDLSPEGALVDGRDLPLPGEDLVVGSLDAFAKVVWRTGERAGIQFDETIPRATIARMKQEAEWMSVAGWYR